MGEKNYNFQKLTPKRDADIAVYEEAINYAFGKGNEDITNIAISGAYSAGKSSVIESYKTKRPDKKFIHLSLAHFQPQEQESTEGQKDSHVPQLEGKILNQLIHQIPAKNIPQTNFRVKKSVGTGAVVGVSVLLSVLLITVLFAIFYNNMSMHIELLPESWVKTLMSTIINPYSAITIVGILMVCVIILVCNVVVVQKNRNIFHKISVQGNEIEIFEAQDESYFDKYLNEVLYLFENIKGDAIVFEDMDRFNASRIFERLREVNTLVNIHRKNKQGAKYVPLRFIYLIRDDIFVSKDRTKFFDYIIPVVPVVDSSNSYEQFMQHLGKGNLLEKFNQSFLQGLSLYIDDMRILKNIYNEFVVYFNRLNTTELDCDKMLAIIAYKNIFPRDFSNLQIKQGFVFEVFAQKQMFVRDEIKNLNQQKALLQQRIDAIKNEILVDEDELQIVYAEKQSKLPRNYNRQLTGDGRKKSTEYETELSNRKQAIEDRGSCRMSSLRSDIESIDAQISKVNSKPLKQIISRENINAIFSVKFDNKVDRVDLFDEIRGSEYFDLLKYLIRNGFIDETYTDYMTYFYEDSISANDKAFLRRITDKRGAEYEYPLKSPEKVAASPLLREVDFEEEEILNFDLLQCLLDKASDGTYNGYLGKLIEQVQQKEKFDFISRYYARDIPHQIFILKVNEFWSDFFYTVLTGDRIPAEQIRQFSIDTLCWTSDDTIKAVNTQDCLKEYISTNPDYLGIDHPDVAKMIAGFKLLEVRFETIDFEASDRKLFESVYQENLYVLNFANIALMLRVECGVTDENAITHRNYTLIQDNPNTPLSVYVGDNLSEYVDIMIEHSDESICDDEVVAISLMNDERVTHAQKEQYIEVLATSIISLLTIKSKKLWPLLIENGFVENSVDNIINYFGCYALDGVLVGFINKSSSNLDFSSMPDVFGSDAAEDFCAQVTACSALNTEKYKRILVDVECQYDNFDVKDIPNDKVAVLISEKIIEMTAENLEFIRAQYKKHLTSFIELNIGEYLELQTNEMFSMEEALQILTWDLQVEEKIVLISLTNEPVSVIDKGYEDKLCAHILSHNLLDTDRASLFNNYAKYEENSKHIILGIAYASVQYIEKHKSVGDGELMSKLMTSENVEFDMKVSLFEILLPKLKEESCAVKLEEMGVAELGYIFKMGNGRRKYSVTDEITLVLEVLKKHHWIYEYNVVEHGEPKYTVLKRKTKSKEKVLD